MSLMALPLALPPRGGFFQGTLYFRFVGEYTKVIASMEAYSLSPTEENLMAWRSAADSCRYWHWLWKFSIFIFLTDGDGDYGD